MKLEYTIIRDEKIIDLNLTLSYIPAHRGHRDRYGCPEEPDEPATFEIDEAVDQDGNEYELTDSEYDKALEIAFTHFQSSEPEYDYDDRDI